MILSEKKDHQRQRRTKEDHPAMSWWWKNRPSGIQENLSTSSWNDILRYNEKRYEWIYPELSDMSEEKKYPKNRNWRNDRKIREDMDTNINWSHHQIIKSQGKELNIDDDGPILGYYISKGNQWKGRYSADVTELSEDDLEVLRIFMWDTNGQRNSIYVKNMREKNEEKENNISKNNGLSFSDKWLGEKNK